MDRFLRVVCCGMAAAALALAGPRARATAADEDGRSLAQAVVPPAASSSLPSADTSPPLLLAPQPNSAGRLSGTADSSDGAADSSSSARNAGSPVGQASPVIPDAKPNEAMAAPAKSASPLKIAAADSQRSEQLEQIARQADRQTRHGFELAGRGAYFAARLEFLGALKLVAEGLDTQQKTGVHGRALTAALTALKEADDFLPGGSRLEADLDLPRIIAAHVTPVLKNETANVTAMTALNALSDVCPGTICRGGRP